MLFPGINQPLFFELPYVISQLVSLPSLNKKETKIYFLAVKEGDIGVCGIGQFFMRYFGNFNLKLRYCGVLRICGMRYFWRFGQRYLVKKKLFYTVSDPLTFVRDSCHSQAIRKSMPSKLSSYRDHNGNGNAVI